MSEIEIKTFLQVREALCNTKLKQSLYDEGDIIMKDVLLTLHGERHRKRRHVELDLFRRSVTNKYENEVFPGILDEMMEEPLKNNEVDLVEFGYQTTMNLTADFAGIDRTSNNKDTRKLISIVKKFSECATIAHSERAQEEIKKETQIARDSFLKFLEPSWARREKLIEGFLKGTIDEEELPKDILTLLLKEKKELGMKDDEIEREVCFYLQAGSHSTANTLVHAANEILRWKSCPKNLAENPELLQKCVHESMRLHPASPVAARKALAPTMISGKKYEEGTSIILDMASANRDQSVFGTDADAFNPGRNVKNEKVQLYGLTFGAGMHLCAGRDLDGGIKMSNKTDDRNEQYGIVSRILIELLKSGMRRHPSKTERKEQETKRDHWEYYPVALG